MWTIRNKTKQYVFYLVSVLMHCAGIESYTLFPYNTINPVIIKIGRDQIFIRHLLKRIPFLFYQVYYLLNLLLNINLLYIFFIHLEFFFFFI